VAKQQKKEEAPGPGAPKPPVSLQLYALREKTKTDLFGALKDVAAAGYVGVEGGGLYGRKPAELRKMLDDLGLVASSAHVDVPTPENLKEIVETANALGYNMVINSREPHKFAGPDGVKRVAGELQKSSELLKPHGLKFGYHNHWWEFEVTEGRSKYEQIMELAPDLFSELDIYWAANFGAVDVPAVIARYRSRIPLLHVKDGPLVKGQPHTAVGAGRMDVTACIRAADPKVLQWLVVELDYCATDMVAAVQQSCRWLTQQGLGRGRR
jgi:sugar phosphate isomerase/epimerase